MPQINVEVCINSTSEGEVEAAVAAAYEGGADTVELCAAMEHGGLTPLPSHVEAARKAFRDRRGLMVMIRSRPGDFVYYPHEWTDMAVEIQFAAEAGADGVVFGALNREGRLDPDGMRLLANVARSYGLMSTCHRAFDAVNDPLAAVDGLVEMAVDRVLTAGIPWGQEGSAVEGAGRIRQVAERAAGRLEVVIGGGVNAENAGQILRQIPSGIGPLAVHAYSGVQRGGYTSAAAVRELVEAVRDFGF